MIKLFTFSLNNFYNCDYVYQIIMIELFLFDKRIKTTLVRLIKDIKL